MVTTEYLMKNYDLSILLHKIVVENGSMNATGDYLPKKLTSDGCHIGLNSGFEVHHYFAHYTNDSSCMKIMKIYLNSPLFSL